uniref:Uncharacterized protein n=1 Tax=Salvator merianae TaxID=96440 RepID=A0A8D0KIP4_SALMN
MDSMGATHGPIMHVHLGSRTGLEQSTLISAPVVYPEHQLLLPVSLPQLAVKLSPSGLRNLCTYLNFFFSEMCIFFKRAHLLHAFVACFSNFDTFFKSPN